MMKPLVFFGLAFMTLLVPPAYGESRVLNIVYTGSLQGELEPCGCSPKTDFGGVARLSGYLKEHREDISPYLLVDAGNFAGDDTPQGRLKTETLLKTFGIMGYDAVGFGTREKALQDVVTEASRESRISLVSDKSGHARTVSVKKGNTDINVGTDPEAGVPGRLNVLISDMGISDARAVKGWDVIILSSGENLEEPLREDGKIIVSGYPRGKEVGMITLHLDEQANITGYEHRWQPLGSDIREDPEVRQVLKDYDARVARLFAETAKPVSETDYVGETVCAECHQPFSESWKKSRHAGAFASLERVNKSRDPECVKCHVVGYGEAGGFSSLQTTPGLADVQCEACHGTGKEHLANIEQPLKPVTVSVCKGCHTEENSPDFDFPVYMEKIKHW